MPIERMTDDMALRPEPPAEIHGLAICAGVGGIELGLHLALGGRYRTVCYVEREAFAAASLVARMEDAALDPAPVWDDLTTFDGTEWDGCVDVLTAGYPCQPFSAAGAKRGSDDPRHLWPHVARIVAECGPRFVFCENVDRHLRAGFDAVAGDLEGLGYRVAAGLYTAAEVGAPHRRRRLFFLAERLEYAEGRDRQVGQATGERPGGSERAESGLDQLGDADSAGLEGRAVRGQRRADERAAGQAGGPSGGELADTDGRGQQVVRVAQPRRVEGEHGDVVDRRGEVREFLHAQNGHVDHADQVRSRGRGHVAGTSGEDGRRGAGLAQPSAGVGNPDSARPDLLAQGRGPRDAVGEPVGGVVDAQRAGLAGTGDGRTRGAGDFRWPPSPDDTTSWARVLAVMPSLEPAVCRMADGVPERVDRLRAAGNGVVPQVAARAFLDLMGQLSQ